MVLYHFSYDIFVIYGQSPDWLGSTAAFLWQQGICWSFILISGFSWRFGAANSLKRGLLLNGLGLLITAVTWLAIPDEVILFGILNFIGCGVLLTIPFSKSGEKIPPLLGAGICLILFALTYHIPSGYLQIGGEILGLPDALYSAPSQFLDFRDRTFIPVITFLYCPGSSCTGQGGSCILFLMKSKGIRRFLSIRIPLLSFIEGKPSGYMYFISPFSWESVSYCPHSFCNLRMIRQSYGAVALIMIENIYTFYCSVCAALSLWSQSYARQIRIKCINIPDMFNATASSFFPVSAKTPKEQQITATASTARR